MDECELVVLISTLACAISKCSTDDEITLLSAIFSQLGDTLATIITKRELNEKRNNNDKTNDSSSIKTDKTNGSNSIKTDKTNDCSNIKTGIDNYIY